MIILILLIHEYSLTSSFIYIFYSFSQKCFVTDLVHLLSNLSLKFHMLDVILNNRF